MILLLLPVAFAGPIRPDPVVEEIDAEDKLGTGRDPSEPRARSS